MRWDRTCDRFHVYVFTGVYMCAMCLWWFVCSIGLAEAESVCFWSLIMCTYFTFRHFSNWHQIIRFYSIVLYVHRVPLSIHILFVSYYPFDARRKSNANAFGSKFCHEIFYMISRAVTRASEWTSGCARAQSSSATTTTTWFHVIELIENVLN